MRIPAFQKNHQSARAPVLRACALALATLFSAQLSAAPTGATVVNGQASVAQQAKRVYPIRFIEGSSCGCEGLAKGETRIQLLAAGIGQGMGTYDYLCNWQLTIPAQTLAGSYTAVMVVSINSGP